MKMENDVLRTAVELNIIFSNESSILVSVAIRKDHKIIRHCSEYFGERAFFRAGLCFYRCHLVIRVVKRMMSFSGCNANDAGLSREWRPEGAPTTDSDLHLLLDTKELSVVLFSVIVVSLRKKTPK